MEISTLIAWLVVGLSLLMQPANPALATLESLAQVDDYPLYTMQFYGDYEETIDDFEQLMDKRLFTGLKILPKYLSYQIRIGVFSFTHRI